MGGDSIVYSVFLVFTGAAVVATAALYARQALPVGYIVLGAPVEPSKPMLDADGRVFSEGIRMQMPYAAVTTALVLVTLPATLAVNETLELAHALPPHQRRLLACCVLNKVYDRKKKSG